MSVDILGRELGRESKRNARVIIACGLPTGNIKGSVGRAIFARPLAWRMRGVPPKPEPGEDHERKDDGQQFSMRVFHNN